MGAEESN